MSTRALILVHKVVMAAVRALLSGTHGNVAAGSTTRVRISPLGDGVALTSAPRARSLGPNVLSGTGTQLRTALQIKRCIDTSRSVADSFGMSFWPCLTRILNIRLSRAK